LPLAKRLAIAGQAAVGALPLLVEVNVGGEAQKSGCEPRELPALLDAIEALPHVQLAGLMTVPPFTDDPADSRPFFDQLVALRQAHGGARRLPELSMGMTLDLEQAIAAGATMVRVGTAIFGERPPREGAI
jgi:pyridoxal phosphate enzyme (YggS family)